ncbi:hypothetical protein AB1Y20_016278 [Prymnesium parvum]|uniref:NADH:ubiquinone oxidoreductase intermediate-associated protein 30 domain-containing protein n=1 Tax=Prymnesium parvum TaxID=97485 RepID=A0AB34IC85_PRYPA
MRLGAAAACALLPCAAAAWLYAAPPVAPRPACSRCHASARRCRIVSQQPLDSEELQALAGMWRCSLDLDDGYRQLTCHLDVSGKLTSSDEDLPAWNANWEASKASDEGGQLAVWLRLGALQLQGSGERTGGLRCSLFTGTVLEGDEEPVCVGSFEMELALPAVDQAALPALEARHTARLNAKPAPPPRFVRASFIGMWRLLLSLDTAADEAAPCAFLTLNLQQAGGYRAGNFESEESPRLGGTWGVYDRPPEGSAVTGSVLQDRGTHVWLSVKRERCETTLRGLGGLPVQESFSLWGRPALEGFQAELAARTDGGGTSDRIDGVCYFGSSSDREYVVCGTFSLTRLESQPADAP